MPAGMTMMSSRIQAPVRPILDTSQSSNGGTPQCNSTLRPYIEAAKMTIVSTT